MDIVAATADYERWLRRFMRPVEADLREKHRRMRAGLFPFMRATFYRWCQLWPTLAPAEQKDARVLALGDLHIENFGTWRDADGRLVWGVNDFDEVTRLPWSQDLIRLATSAHLATTTLRLRLNRRDACAAILEGYREGMTSGGRPFVLEEAHGWLRRVAMSELRHPVTFWQKMDALPSVKSVDASARAALLRSLPQRGLPVRFARRVAGMGSLGRPRFVAVTTWSGGKVAREAKALAPSAAVWAVGGGSDRSAYATLLAAAVRCPDPTVRVDGRWIMRRLAPHCTRIELADLPGEGEEERLLQAMGFETANAHLGSPGARPRILAELRGRKRGWLNDRAKAFADAIERDWQKWRRAP